MSPRTVTTASPSDGVVADCNSGAMWWPPQVGSGWPGPTSPAAPRYRSRKSLRRWRLRGDRSHVGGLGAFLALGDVELDGLAILQRATILDGADVDKDIVARLGPDEAVAAAGVEPLDGSNSHGGCPSLRCLGGVDHADAGWRRRQRDKLNRERPGQP